MKKTEEQIKADLEKVKKIEYLENQVAMLRWELARAKWNLLDANEREAVDYMYWMLKGKKLTAPYKNIVHTDYILFKEDHILDELPF